MTTSLGTSQDGSKAEFRVGGVVKATLDTAGNFAASGKIKAQPSTAADEAVMQSQAFGVGQTLATSSKTAGVVYTNSSTKGRWVMFEGTASGVGSYIHIQVGGRFAAVQYSPTAGFALAISTYVPPGATYLFTANGMSSYAISEVM